MRFTGSIPVVGSGKVRMKRFEKDGKINFVDDANVFVGYDLNQDCCEHADWFIAGDVTSIIPKSGTLGRDIDLEEYFFDKNFFQEVDCPDLEEGKMVVFRMSDACGYLYLHLHNCHNGYYGHGFEFKIDDKKVKSGYL